MNLTFHIPLIQIKWKLCGSSIISILKKYSTHIYSVEVDAPVSSSSRRYESVTMLAW